MVFSNGERFSGEWDKGKVNGEGSFHKTDGTVIKGFWSDDKLTSQQYQG